MVDKETSALVQRDACQMANIRSITVIFVRYAVFAAINNLQLSQALKTLRNKGQWRPTMQQRS